MGTIRLVVDGRDQRSPLEAPITTLPRVLADKDKRFWLDISDPNGHKAAVGELPRDRRLREEGDAESLLHHLFRGVDVVELHDAARCHSRFTEERAREPVVARGAVEEDELRLGDLRDRDVRACGERMRRVGDQDERLLVERHALDLRVEKRAYEADLDLAS